MIGKFIYSWLREIITVFIVLSIVELILPKGNIKKYVNFIIGLLVIFTFINPFIKLTNIKFDLSEEVFNYDSNRSNLEDYEEMSKKREDLVEKLYVEKIDEEVKNIIEEKGAYFVSSVKTNIEKNREDYGRIKSLEILLSHKNEYEKDEKIKIEKIHIKEEVLKDKNYNEESYEEIKETVSNKLGVNRESIYISLRDEEMR